MNRFLAIVVLASLSLTVEGATLQGVVRDSAGKPLAGARVGIATAALRKGSAMFCPSRYLDCAKSTQTDSAGSYQISDLNDSLKFQVLITTVGQKSQLTRLYDPHTGELEITLSPLPTDSPANRTVLGRVIDDKGRAVPGALAWPTGAKTTTRRWFGQVDNVDPAVCDASGRFAMLLPPDFQDVDLEVTAAGKAGTLQLLVAPGAEEHVITIPTGTRVTGRLIYQGKPVAGLNIAVCQLNRNTEHLFIKAVPAMTDAAGHFDFNYLPANERYAIYTLVGEGASQSRELLLSTKLFTAKDNNATRDLGDLAIQPPVHLHGRVELPPGVSLPANAKIILGRDPAWDLIAIPLAAGGQFSINGLPPENYDVRVAAHGLVIDNAQLNYQSLGPDSFGIHLTDSIDDLRIPLRKKP